MCCVGCVTLITVGEDDSNGDEDQEWIKGCGVFPIYFSASGLKLVCSVREEFFFNANLLLKYLIIIKMKMTGNYLNDNLP